MQGILKALCQSSAVLPQAFTQSQGQDNCTARGDLPSAHGLTKSARHKAYDTTLHTTSFVCTEPPQATASLNSVRYVQAENISEDC